MRGKAQGTTMLEVRAASGGEPWCFLQLKVTSLQGWIGPAGDAAFNEQVLKHLETLKKSPSFRKMWDVILKAGYTVTILPLNEVKATRTVATRLNDSFLRDDGVTPGPGSPDTIYFDTTAKGIGLSKGTEPWRTDGAPYVSLGHEMVHAWMDTTGVSLKNIYEKDNKAVGLKSFADADFSENRFRKELGLKRREKYD